MKSTSRRVRASLGGTRQRPASPAAVACCDRLEVRFLRGAPTSARCLFVEPATRLGQCCFWFHRLSFRPCCLENRLAKRCSNTSDARSQERIIDRLTREMDPGPFCVNRAEDTSCRDPFLPLRKPRSESLENSDRSHAPHIDCACHLDENGPGLLMLTARDRREGQIAQGGHHGVLIANFALQREPLFVECLGAIEIALEAEQLGEAAESS